MCFKSDAERSIRLFDKFSRHALNRHFGGNAQILPTENHSNLVEEILDMKAGIDGIILNREGEIFFYASRVQFGRNYESFSLRGYRPSGKATEFAKLKRASKTCAPMPTFHVQAFVDSDEKSATVAIVPTIDLVQYAERHKPEMKHAHNGGEGFIAVPWRELDRVKIYRVDASGLGEDVTAQFCAATEKEKNHD